MYYQLVVFQYYLDFAGINIALNDNKSPNLISNSNSDLFFGEKVIPFNLKSTNLSQSIYEILLSIHW